MHELLSACNVILREITVNLHQEHMNTPSVVVWKRKSQ